MADTIDALELQENVYKSCLESWENPTRTH